MKYTAFGRTLVSIGLTVGLLTGVAHAETFKWAGKTDPQTMDPHAVNSAPVLGFLNNVYEGLVRRNKQMKIEGALAESWEPLGTSGWRFNLRKGVKFHDGTPFTADDVVFSAKRLRHPDSDLRVRLSADTQVVKVDDHTVDFVTKAPNPILHVEWDTWYIMSKAWTEKHGAELLALAFPDHQEILLYILPVQLMDF